MNNENQNNTEEATPQPPSLIRNFAQVGKELIKKD